VAVSIFQPGFLDQQVKKHAAQNPDVLSSIGMRVTGKESYVLVSLLVYSEI
ncbi:uncharacterized protein METZ01_LOCUS312756, partial [marine metagenome]